MLRIDVRYLYFVGGFVAGCISGYLIAKGDKMIGRKNRYHSMGESVAAEYADDIAERNEEVCNRIRRLTNHDSKVVRRQNASVRPSEARRWAFRPADYVDCVERQKSIVGDSEASRIDDILAEDEKSIEDRLLETEAPVESAHAEEIKEDIAWADAMTKRAYRYRGRKPRIISADTMGDLDGTWDNKTLFYYAYNDVLTTEDGEVIDDIGLTVGDSLDKYGFSDDPNQREIIVQNFDFSTVYEIEKVFSEYDYGLS